MTLTKLNGALLTRERQVRLRQNFSAPIDQCTIKFPNFVSIENLKSGLTQAQI